MKIHWLVTVIISLSLFAPNAIAQAPEIVSSPSGKILCTGGAAVFVIEATGAEPLTYEWFLNGISIGNDNDTLSIPNASEANEGTYYCIVTNGEGSDQANDFNLTVISGPPGIPSTSGGGEHCEGSYVQLMVNTTGEAVSYSWTKDGTPINEYGPFVTINNLSSDDAGLYECTATNACGSVSEQIELITLLPPSILSQPQAQTVCEGEDAEFIVSASGSNLNYQWYNEGTAMTGENASSLTIPAAQQSDEGFFQCVISNTCDSDTTGQVSLEVNTTAQVTAQPISGSYCLGEEVTLTSTATGTPPIGIQWYNDGNMIADSTDNTLTITCEAGDTTYYYAAYMNTCGTIFSDSAEIITKMPPTITQQPQPQTVCLNDTATLSIKVSGFQPIYYQWQHEGADIDNSNASGVNSSNLSIENIDEGQSGLYSCIAWNDCGEVYSDTVMVEIVMPPNIVSQPDAIEVCEGDAASMEMIIQGSEPIDYFWTEVSSGDTISTNAVLEFPEAQAEDDGFYQCIVSNQCEDINSDQAELTVHTYPDFTTQPVEIDACHGDSVALEIETNGTEPISLMWYKNQSALTSETGEILEFNPAETLETGYYMCVADNICGITQSDEVLVNIGTAPAITWDPVGQDMCENETLELFADAQGENVFYQWYSNGQPITGQTDTALFIPYINDSLTGEFFFQAYNGCATVNSDTVTVNISPAPDIDIGDDTDLCDGEQITLSAIGDIQSYNWNNGESTSATFTVTETGNYTLAAVGENGCTGYDTVQVVFHPHHYVNLPEDGSYCGPQVLDAEEGAYSYIWNTGSTESSIEVSESGTYYVTTEGDAFGCTDSDTVNLTILDQPSVDLGPDHSISIDSNLNICAPAAYYAYNWSNGSTDSCAVYSGSLFGAGTHDIWLMVSSENGCSDTDTIALTVIDQNAIDQLHRNESVSLFPNPASSEIRIDYTLRDEASSARLYTLYGQLVHEESMSGKATMHTMDISRLPAGCYILRISTGKRHLNFRFIKQ
ncbi:MAG TPA: immunoglobulin domain-containing protein [Bacteroidales bacterium]|nr:immunoglobulin domain-containing protein [Bacteroidales bacterium]